MHRHEGEPPYLVTQKHLDDIYQDQPGPLALAIAHQLQSWLVMVQNAPQLEPAFNEVRGFKLSRRTFGGINKPGFLYLFIIKRFG